VHSYRFDVDTPIKLRTQTTHFSGEAYNHAGSVLSAAIPKLSFQVEELPIIDIADKNDPDADEEEPPLRPRDYLHTVAVAEIDTGENLYNAAAIGLYVYIDPNDPKDIGTFKPCTSLSYFDFDDSTGEITGVTLGPSTITDICDKQKISTGLIIMNTNNWLGLFGGSVPSLDAQKHWLVHEFTHLLGVGHIVTLAPSSECISMMTETILLYPCYRVVPTDYIDTDLELLGQLGY
jgi:hypothetical protein